MTNGTSDMKFPLGLSSFSRNGFCMKHVFILLSEKVGWQWEKIYCSAFFITSLLQYQSCTYGVGRSACGKDLWWDTEITVPSLNGKWLKNNRSSSGTKLYWFVEQKTQGPVKLNETVITYEYISHADITLQHGVLTRYHLVCSVRWPAVAQPAHSVRA